MCSLAAASERCKPRASAAAQLERSRSPATLAVPLGKLRCLRLRQSRQARKRFSAVRCANISSCTPFPLQAGGTVDCRDRVGSCPSLSDRKSLTAHSSSTAAGPARAFASRRREGGKDMHFTHLVLAARRNFFDVVSKLPQRGVGQRITRKTWGDDSYWTIERVQLDLDGRHGKAHGVLTWRGKAAEKPTRINGTLKPVWRQHGAQSPLAWKSLGKPPLEPAPGGAPAAESSEAEKA